MLSMRSLELFVAAYEERSFTKAATREAATQSGVSQHMHNLEEHFGVALFERMGKGMQPTPAGDHYYAHCLKVLHSNEKAEQEMQSFAGSLIGGLNVGVMPTMSAHVLGPALLNFREEQPNVRLDIIEGFSDNLVKLVGTAEIDFAIVPNFPPAQGIRVSSFAATPELLICRRGRFTDMPVSELLAEVAPLNIIMPKSINVRSQTLRKYCAQNRIEIGDCLEVDSMAATLDLVARSDWVAIVPALIVADSAEHMGLHAMRLPDPGLMLDLVIAEPARSPVKAAGRAFQASLKSYTNKINERWLS